jgi:hypothetical protein
MVQGELAQAISFYSQALIAKPDWGIIYRYRLIRLACPAIPFSSQECELQLIKYCESVVS